MLRKIFIFSMIAILLLSSTFTYAATTQSQSAWKDSLAQLELMGVIEEADLDIASKMTREVFAKIIVNSTGNYDLADSLSSTSTFPDVLNNSEYIGYINAAVNKGYLVALADGKFEPKAYVNFAQLTTAMVKALGYTNNDITGAWPNGYIDKAKSLGITTGYNFKSTDTIPTSAVIIMVDRLLNTNIKKNSAQEANTLLKDAVGINYDETNLIYSKPEVAFNFNPSTRKLGSITFKVGLPIIRNTVDNMVTPSTSVVGETISISDIKDKDVVYEVYDQINNLLYYLVIDNKIEGEITSILPNKYSPKQIQVKNANYDLGEYAKIDKFNSSKGSFNVGESVSLVLGYDGNIVDAYYLQDDNNRDYAFVVDFSTMVSNDAKDYGKVYYTVDLMHVDGMTKTYKTTEDPSSKRWKLVKFSYIDSETVTLLSINNNVSSNILIDKYEKKVGQSYIVDNVKIFNYTDSSVNLISWNSIPNGSLDAGKVKYIGSTGDFGDVNILLLYDVFDEQYKNFVVQKIQVPDGKKSVEYTYTLLSGGNQYTYTSKSEIPGAIVGSVFSMKMYNNKINSFSQLKNPEGQGWYIQAIDSKRIRMNDWVYMFSTDMSVYIKDYSGNLTSKKIADVDVGTNADYTSVKLYCDRPLNNGGRVQSIIISYN